MHQLIFSAIKLGPRGWNRTNCLTIIGRVLRQSSCSRMGPDRGLEPRFQPYQGCGSPSILVRQNWGLAADLNRALDVTSVVRRRLRLRGMGPIPGFEPGSRGYRPRTSPPTLDRQNCAGVLTVRRQRAEARRQDSNLHFRQLGASAENRTPLSRLAISCSTNEPHPRTWSERRESNSLGQLGRLELNQ